MSFGFPAIAAVPAFLVLATGVAAQKLQDNQPVPLPLGVASPDGQTGFVRNKTSGIDAIDLVNGTLLWSSSEGIRPFLCGRRLLVQTLVKDKPGTIELALLDPAQKGKLVWRSKTFDLPQGWFVGNGEGHGFDGRASFEDGKLTFEWRADTWYVGGAQPPPGMVLSHKKTGRLLVNLEMGDLQPLPERAEPPLPAVLAAVKSFPNYGSQMQTEPFRRGDRLMALDVREESKGFAFVRKAWRLSDGKLDDEAVLARGGRTSFYPYLLADTKYLVTLVQNPRESWWVFDVETGQTVARELQLGSAADIRVVGGRLFFLRTGKIDANFTSTPRHLHCISLTGRPLWQRSVEGVPFYLPRP